MATSQNGWPVSANPDAINIVPLVVGGQEFAPGVRGGKVHDALSYVANQVHQRVQHADASLGCWGYSYRENVNSPGVWSNHASGTAIDFNAVLHPNGAPAIANWTAAQIAEIHKILDEIGGVVRWGGDYNGTPDSMHFEINVTPAELGETDIESGGDTGGDTGGGGTPAPVPPGLTAATAPLIVLGTEQHGTGWWKFQIDEPSHYAIQAAGAIELWQVVPWSSDLQLYHDGSGMIYSQSIYPGTYYVYADGAGGPVKIGHLSLEWGPWVDPPAPEPRWIHPMMGTAARWWYHPEQRSMGPAPIDTHTQHDEGVQYYYNLGIWGEEIAKGVEAADLTSYATNQGGTSAGIYTDQAIVQVTNYHEGELGVPMEHQYYGRWETQAFYWIGYADASFYRHPIWPEWPYPPDVDDYEFQLAQAPLLDAKLVVYWKASWFGEWYGVVRLVEVTSVTKEDIDYVPETPPITYTHGGHVIVSAPFGDGGELDASGYYVYEGDTEVNVWDLVNHETGAIVLKSEIVITDPGPLNIEQGGKSAQVDFQQTWYDEATNSTKYLGTGVSYLVQDSPIRYRYARPVLDGVAPPPPDPDPNTPEGGDAPYVEVIDGGKDYSRRSFSGIPGT